jgi:hypothetical protein
MRLQHIFVQQRNPTVLTGHARLLDRSNCCFFSPRSPWPVTVEVSANPAKVNRMIFCPGNINTGRKLHNLIGFLMSCQFKNVIKSIRSPFCDMHGNFLTTDTGRSKCTVCKVDVLYRNIWNDAKTCKKLAWKKKLTKMKASNLPHKLWAKFCSWCNNPANIFKILYFVKLLLLKKLSVEVPRITKKD